jgi:hydrogenase-4 component B
MTTPEHAVLLALLVCLAGALVTLVCSRNKTVAGWLAFAAMVAVAGLIVAAAAQAILDAGAGKVLTLTIWKSFALRIYVDGLSAIFLVLIALVAAPAFLYSIPYLHHYKEYGAARYYPNLLLFVAGMVGLVTTTDAMFFFFVFWQLMTLTSYALVGFEHKKPENVKAANRYLVMMQIACGLTMIGAEMLASGAVTAGADPLAKYDFDALHEQLPVLLQTKPSLVALAFVLFLVGFGIKAGMWPFGQNWLPDAHPAAPSPVSALLSGVMIKTGVYGLMRYFLWLVPASAQEYYPVGDWGLVIAVLGAITLFTGTMQALKQEQTKRLLAFHSIGQVGYILLAFGASMALLPGPDWALVSLAALGFYGALFHTLNHGLFKSLLFLNAGTMLHAAGTQDLNRMGGLMRYMPLTAATALVASFSISGVPLFNGFASKWTIYAAAIQGGAYAGYLPLLGVIAVFTSALTLASFIKFFGCSFLSRTSALVAEKAGRGSLEAGWMMQAPQVFLALLCVTLGILPALAFNFIGAALNASKQGLGAMLAHAAPAQAGLWNGLQNPSGQALLAPLAAAVVLLSMLGIVWLISRAGGGKRRVDAPWLCGYARDQEAVHYHAHHFYTEFKKYFRWVGGRTHAAVAPKPANLAAKVP